MEKSKAFSCLLGYESSSVRGSFSIGKISQFHQHCIARECTPRMFPLELLTMSHSITMLTGMIFSRRWRWRLRERNSGEETMENFIFSHSFALRKINHQRTDDSKFQPSPSLAFLLGKLSFSSSSMWFLYFFFLFLSLQIKIFMYIHVYARAFQSNLLKGTLDKFMGDKF